MSKIEINKIITADCLDAMQLIDNQSIDLILCDLPYGRTNCFWDKVIPFDKLWEQYKRIIKKQWGNYIIFSAAFYNRFD